MKKIILVAVGVIACCVVWILSNPLRRPEGKIRDRILAVTPIGSPKESVVAVLEKEGWSDRSYDGSSVFLKQEPGRPSETIGVSSLHALLGEYRSLPVPVVTSVSAFWGFDPDDRLIEVWIWKTADGP